MELDESGNSVVSEEQYFTNTWGRLRDICIGPDGAIYLATNGPDWGNSQPFTHSIVKLWNPNYVATVNGELNQQKAIQVFPNPAKDKLNISVSSELLGEEIRILSINGQLIYSEVMDDTNLTISTHNFKNGIYTIMLGNHASLKIQEKIIILKN
jgi:hypothetical protein